MSTQVIETKPLQQPSVRMTAPKFPAFARTFVPAVATSFLLYLSFFPANQGWLGWVALVPLLTLVRSTARPRTVSLCSWASGLLFFWPVLQWMRVADERMYFTWAALATYCSVYFLVGLYLIRLFDRRTRLPFVIAVPTVWTALEFARSYLMTGFPWYHLAHTQHDYLPVIQIADITGAWGVSFLVAAVNAVLCEAVLSWQGRPVTSRSGLLSHAVIVVLVLAGTIGYGVWRLGDAKFTDGPLVALVQGDLPQQLRNNPTSLRSIADHYLTLSDVAARAKPDLIVLPETSLPFEWDEGPDGPTEVTRQDGRYIASRLHTSVLLGINAGILGSDDIRRRYNSAVLVNRQGRAVARYDKIHRVPFGEYVPLRDWLPIMNRLAPYDFDYSVSAGAGATRFPLTTSEPEHPPVSFGVVICYEDTDPETAQPYGGGGGKPAVDFLLNISNDGWFDGTSENEQHLAICRFRAIECRRPVARAVNMGISALIDGNGRVLAPHWLRNEKVASGMDDENAPADVEQERVPAAVWRVGPDSETLPPSRWRDFKKVCGVILATMPLDSRVGYYARFGDWLPWTCCGLVGACCLFAVRGKRASGSP
jgi:apolipoprotein N-acyltransferase